MSDSVPTDGNAPAASSPSRQGRAQLTIMLTIALVSLFGSYLLFLAVRDGGPWGTTNHGAFVIPAQTLEALALEETERPIAVVGRWWLLTVVERSCEQDCRDTLQLLRQMQILLNKDANRVARGLLAAGPPSTGVLEDYPALAYAELPQKVLAVGVYIVDPLGNFVFHYPLTVDGNAMLKDLKRLLKVSQIG